MNFEDTHIFDDFVKNITCFYSHDAHVTNVNTKQNDANVKYVNIKQNDMSF